MVVTLGVDHRSKRTVQPSAFCASKRLTGTSHAANSPVGEYKKIGSRIPRSGFPSIVMSGYRAMDSTMIGLVRQCNLAAVEVCVSMSHGSVPTKTVGNWKLSALPGAP
eukprot:4542003-Pleurochrysis_carterae.AAC.2